MEFGAAMDRTLVVGWFPAVPAPVASLTNEGEVDSLWWKRLRSRESPTSVGVMYSCIEASHRPHFCLGWNVILIFKNQAALHAPSLQSAWKLYISVLAKIMIIRMSNLSSPSLPESYTYLKECLVMWRNTQSFLSHLCPYSSLPFVAASPQSSHHDPVVVNVVSHDVVTLLKHSTII